MLLSPLNRAFRRHGVHLLKLPDAGIGPGSVLDRSGALFQDLLEVEQLWPAAPEIESIDAAFLTDSINFKTSGGGHLGLGVPNIASVRAVLEGSRAVSIEIRGITLRRAVADGKTEHQADWLHRLNGALGDDELGPLIGMMKRRRIGVVGPRTADIVTAAVHVEQLVFTTDGQGGFGLDAAMDKVIPADIDAGFDVSWERSADLVWSTVGVPIAYAPLRYAWHQWRGRFVPAVV